VKALAQFLVKLITTGIVIVLALWPLWGSLAGWIILKPGGFWERLAYICVALVFFGSAQFWMLLIGTSVLVAFWERRRF
jgi:hypothetical protein